MLPSTMVWMLTEIGLMDAANRPAAKKPENTMPITASSRSAVTRLTNTMPPAANRPAKKAPAAYGTFRR